MLGDRSRHLFTRSPPDETLDCPPCAPDRPGPDSAGRGLLGLADQSRRGPDSHADPGGPDPDPGADRDLHAALCHPGLEPAALEKLSVYAQRIGLAFQIQDDLLDLTGDQRVVGKSLGKDLDKGKLTLPIILHLAAAEPSERGETLRLIEQGEADLLRLKLLDSGAVEHSRREAMKLVAAAKAQLIDHLPPTPARDLMLELADAVIARAY